MAGTRLVPVPPPAPRAHEDTRPAPAPWASSGASTWRCECARKSGPGPSRGEKPQGGPSVGRVARLQAASAPRGAGPGAARRAQVAPRANVAPLPSRADAASRCPAPVCASCSSTRTELDSEKSIPRAHAGAQQIRSPPTAWAAAAASEKTGRGFRSRQREPDRARPILGQRDRPPPHPEGARGQTFRPLRS